MAIHFGETQSRPSGASTARAPTATSPTRTTRCATSSSSARTVSSTRSPARPVWSSTRKPAPARGPERPAGPAASAPTSTTLSARPRATSRRAPTRSTPTRTTASSSTSASTTGTRVAPAAPPASSSTARQNAATSPRTSATKSGTDSQKKTFPLPFSVAPTLTTFTFFRQPQLVQTGRGRRERGRGERRGRRPSAQEEVEELSVDEAPYQLRDHRLDLREFYLPSVFHQPLFVLLSPPSQSSPLPKKSLRPQEKYNNRVPVVTNYTWRSKRDAFAALDCRDSTAGKWRRSRTGAGSGPPWTRRESRRRRSVRRVAPGRRRRPESGRRRTRTGSATAAAPLVSLRAGRAAARPRRSSSEPRRSTWWTWPSYDCAARWRPRSARWSSRWAPPAEGMARTQSASGHEKIILTIFHFTISGKDMRN